MQSYLHTLSLRTSLILLVVIIVARVVAVRMLGGKNPHWHGKSRLPEEDEEDNQDMRRLGCSGRIPDLFLGSNQPNAKSPKPAMHS